MLAASPFNKAKTTTTFKFMRLDRAMQTEPLDKASALH